MPRSSATGISRKLTVVALGSVLAVAVGGTSALAGTWPGTGATFAVAVTADVPVSHSSGDFAVWSTALNSQQALNSQESHFAPAKLALIIQLARRAAAESVAAAEAAAARRAAAKRSGSPQQIAQRMLGQYGWAADQFSCLDSLWMAESGWNPTAENPASGAYGIPQALPGSKMASAGSDWQTDPGTQIRWGLSYIQASYGSPCGAWSHEEAYGWY